MNSAARSITVERRGLAGAIVRHLALSSSPGIEARCDPKAFKERFLQRLVLEGAMMIGSFSACAALLAASPRRLGTTSEMAGNDDARPKLPVETSPKLDCLRRSRRNQRSGLYAEILQLREAGLSPRQIAPGIGMNVRTAKRWLAAGGEPEHRPRAPFSWILLAIISKDAGRKAGATDCNCGPNSSAAALSRDIERDPVDRTGEDRRADASAAGLAAGFKSRCI